jgi:FlaA1/EpsC-like NDP-sugar epimerase
MQQFFNSLSRKNKRLIMLAADAVLLPVALWTAIALRFGEVFPAAFRHYEFLLLAPLTAIPVFVKLGLYRAVIRYMEEKVGLTVLYGVTLSVVLLVALNAFIEFRDIPRSVYLIYWAIALVYIMGSRMLARSFFRHYASGRPARKQVAIYGAGATGVKLAVALRNGPDFIVRAFVDDSPELKGSEISGVRVYSHDELGEMLKSKEIEQVLLAIPSASRKRRSEIIAEIGKFKIPVKTIPSMLDLVNGTAKVEDIREIEIEDLLGRDSALPDEVLMKKCIEGKSVMVTGAGGSIGSELCRQIMQQSPVRLVLFEKSEFALYQIELELNKIKEGLRTDTEIVPILGSVTHLRLVEKVIRRFGVQTIYHAAAYKHVPLVEHNLIEGVRNNVFGTWRTAEAARLAGVETFVLISTDKAVRPTNVMGASKRFAELVLQAYARQFSGTRFCMVRFGNVLGSSGSVVPLFKTQIAQGGPITVTHPEITRYFMTIPEAASLVLQAGAMGKGGDVFVLDMGSPVKIVELARRMVELSGLKVLDEENPDGDIEIRFTGLRPGEKLYEELLIGDTVSGTAHPLIMRAEELELPWEVLRERLEQVDVAAHQFDCDAIRNVLLDVVQGYKPSVGICDLIWARSEHMT